LDNERQASLHPSAGCPGIRSAGISEREHCSQQCDINDRLYSRNVLMTLVETGSEEI
jgi:hypothetical protein